MKTIIITQHKNGYKIGEILDLPDSMADDMIFQKMAIEKDGNLVKVDSFKGIKTRAFSKQPN